MTPQDKQDILDAIKASRDVNTEEHKDISKTAKVARDLCAQIQKGLDAVTGFKTTTKWFGQTLLMGGMLYLIFEEPIKRIFS